VPSTAQLGPMTEIPTRGAPRSGVEQILRYLWWTGIGALCLLLVVFAFLIHRGPSPYRAGDEIGYNMGLAGGLIMLSLLLYPLRKRVRFMGRLGPMRYWFRYHMVAGVVGPLLILFHSTFRLGSMNGEVAFFAMILVAVSGLVGRFLYRHIHRGMYGQHLTMKEAEEDLKSCAEDLRTIFGEYPEILQRLSAFRAFAFAELHGLLPRLHRFLTLKLRGRRLSRAVREQLRRAMRKAKREQRLTRPQRILTYRLAKEKANAYVEAVCEASQLSSWERLFSMWHMIHVPFLYLLVVSGIVHVVAVHMY
jgi:hypothetical protein